MSRKDSKLPPRDWTVQNVARSSPIEGVVGLLESTAIYVKQVLGVDYVLDWTFCIESATREASTTIYFDQSRLGKARWRDGSLTGFSEDELLDIATSLPSRNSSVRAPEAERWTANRLLSIRILGDEDVSSIVYRASQVIASVDLELCCISFTNDPGGIPEEDGPRELLVTWRQ